MPFLSDDITRSLASALKTDRLAHAYLLTGTRAEEVDALALRVVTLLLGTDPEQHPDFHRVRPESKSRRITVTQMRSLEKNLYLKPFKAIRKVALIESAERMCLGQAEAANAFLKTLEEPPSQTLLLLTSTEPQLFLPTILSRCIRIDVLAEGEVAVGVEAEAFLRKWFEVRDENLTGAYVRVNLLSQHWQGIRAGLEEKYGEAAGDEEDEVVTKALIEGDFQLQRQRTLALLQKRYWQHAEEVARKTGSDANLFIRPVQILEELHANLQRNMDAALAIDHACLSLSQNQLKL